MSVPYLPIGPAVATVSVRPADVTAIAAASVAALERAGGPLAEVYGVSPDNKPIVDETGKVTTANPALQVIVQQAPEIPVEQS